MSWPMSKWKWASFTLALVLLVMPGCQPSNPNSAVEAPIITDDAPKSSEEAAARSEPPAKPR